MTSTNGIWTLNRWMGAAGLALITIAGAWLIAYGAIAGIRRKRLPKLHQPGYFYEGRAAVVEGVFRVVVGVLMLAFVGWMLHG